MSLRATDRAPRRRCELGPAALPDLLLLRLFLLPLLVLPCSCWKVVPGGQGGDLSAPDGSTGQDAGSCPPEGCRAALGEPCRWDLDCVEPLLCVESVCAFSDSSHDTGPSSQDAAQDEPADIGQRKPDLAPDDTGGPGPVDLSETEDTGTLPGRDSGLPQDTGHGPLPPGCVDPHEDGCPYVCGEPPCTFICGDVDGNGTVDRCDAGYLLHAEQLNLCQQIMGDLDCDGSADAQDAALIQQYEQTRDATLLGCDAIPP